MEYCPSCGAAAARWVRQKPVPPAARWVSSYITLRPYRCEACGWHGWRPPVPMAKNTEVDDPLRLFPSEQPLRLPTPLPSTPPARRLVAARNETIVGRLRRSGRAASVALHAALRRGLVPEMLGLLVIGLLAGNLADRERAPAASLSSPLIHSAGTGTLSAAVASPTPAPGNMPPAPARAQPSIHAAVRVTPLAAAAPRPSEPRSRDAESLKSGCARIDSVATPPASLGGHRDQWHECPTDRTSTEAALSRSPGDRIRARGCAGIRESTGGRIDAD